ncbi:hypothetical protein LUX33_15595 [Actinomadura madurae]|nr:hypothetical protein [Actinomadura madurae]MCP9949679.1 hypothetical protein [Actinomadura madurae]
MSETGLPEARLTGEVARTTGQLRLFAADLRAADTVTGVDPAGEAGPEIRQGRVPLGPVVVFGASNFPFAFSVAAATPRRRSRRDAR